MIDKWLTANEIAKLLSIDPRSVNRKAKKESWTYREYKVRGGKERRYQLTNLPEDVQLGEAFPFHPQLCLVFFQIPVYGCRAYLFELFCNSLCKGLRSKTRAAKMWVE